MKTKQTVEQTTAALTTPAGAPAPQRKGGFLQGLPTTTLAADSSQRVASTCCGEPALAGESSLGGGCCGEVVARSADLPTDASPISSAVSDGCCGEPASRSEDGTAQAVTGSGCCN